MFWNDAWKILDGSMTPDRYNTDMLLSQLRKQGFFNLADVEFAMLEPDGQLSVLPKSQRRPVTPADLGLRTRYEGLAKELVMDGQVLQQNLKEVGLSEEWLLAELAKQGVSDPVEIFHAQLGSDGKLYIDRREDGVGQDHNPSDWPEGQG